jgi:hypothetical protein
MSGPGVLGWQEAKDNPDHGKYDHEESDRSCGVHEELRASRYDMISQYVVDFQRSPAC